MTQRIGSAVTDASIVTTGGTQTITGTKTFSDMAVTKFTTVAMLEWNSADDTYQSDGKNIINAHMGMRRCVMNSAGEVAYYLDQDSSLLKANGGASVLTGADGDVMVEIPRFYVRFTVLGERFRWEIADTALPGFTIHPAFMFRGVEVPFRYIGAYNASVFAVGSSTYIDGLNLESNTARVNVTAVTGDRLASVSGRYPMVGLQRQEFRSLARNRGNGTSSSVFQQLDFYLVSAIQLLYLMEFKTFNSQAAIGKGVTGGSYPASSSNQTDSPHSVSGKSNQVGNNTAGVYSTTRDVGWMSYRGIENWFGNCWNYVDGYNSVNFVPWVNNNPATWADDTTTNYTQLGIAVPSASAAYVRNIQQIPFAFIPSNVTGGSGTTAISDGFWAATGNTVAIVGGSADNGLFAGGFCWLVSYASSFRSRGVGARLVR